MQADVDREHRAPTREPTVDHLVGADGPQPGHQVGEVAVADDHETVRRQPVALVRSHDHGRTRALERRHEPGGVTCAVVEHDDARSRHPATVPAP